MAELKCAKCKEMQDFRKGTCNLGEPFYCSNCALKSVGRKEDTGKLMYSLVPVEPLREVARVLTFGAVKYEPNNWQKVPDPIRRYTDAMLRHIEAWRGGETFDKESGVHHLAHAICDAMFILYFELKKLLK